MRPLAIRTTRWSRGNAQGEFIVHHFTDKMLEWGPVWFWLVIVALAYTHAVRV